MIPGLGMIRRIFTLLLVGGSFWLGMTFESYIGANRVIDLCMDDTAGYFRKHGRFHPDCEALLNVDR
jgi:hypothetical protein